MKNKFIQYITSIDKVQEFHKWLKDSVRAAKKKNLPDLRNREYTLNKFEEIFIIKNEKENL